MAQLVHELIDDSAWQTPAGLAYAGTALWTGERARMDEDGNLSLPGRRDATIYAAGNRVSPTDIEEMVYATGLVDEVAAVGVPHPVLDQAIALPACGLATQFEDAAA